MKRPSFAILLIALIITGLWVYTNRNRPTVLETRSMQFSSPINEQAVNLNTMAYSTNSGSAAAAGVVAQLAAATAVPSAPDAAVVAQVAPASVGQALAGQITTVGFQRKVIGRAALELVVEDAAAVVKEINQLMDVVGGYVANTNLVHNTYNGVETLQGTLSLRVPAEKLNDTLTKLEKLGVEARSQSLSREDVTDQYTDIDAQLRNLEATENELRELLAEVRKKPNARPDDILVVHRNMTDIRGQIDQLQGRKNMLNNLVGLSSIDVTLTPQVLTKPAPTPTPVPEESWQPMTVVRDASHNLVSTLQGLADVTIWLVVYFVPVLAIICILVALIYFGGRMVLAHWQRRSLNANASN